MTTYSKIKLSGSTDGRAVKVVATASSGTLIHTATATTTSNLWDEIFLNAYNSDTAARILTVQFGGTTSPDDDLKITLQPKQGRILVVPGEILQNAAALRAYCDAANVVMLSGYVNRLS